MNENTKDLIAEARAERDAALAAIERVRALHSPAALGIWYSPAAEGIWCVECSATHEDGIDRDWPCPTIAALDGAPEPKEKP